MNVFLKRKIISFSIFLVLILIISSFFIKEKVINIEDKSINTLVPSKIQNGSIDFEENDFFKKYTINCIKDITDLQLKEDKDSFQIMLDKSQILNIDINNMTKASLNEISTKDNKNLFVVNFKKLIKDENYVHLDFENNKKILVFIKKKQSPYKYKVVIDPGHGGNDVGASYGKLLEKDLNLKISKYMVDNLRYNGCDVMLTRNNDKWLDLKDRPAFANDEKADIFVSVHINSNKVNVYNGVSTYYYDPLGFQKTERMELAKVIQKEILKSDAWKNMGNPRSNLAVLRLSKMPSVLVECGFITNSSDRDKLLKEGTLVNFGLNISNGIINYLAETNKTK